MKRKAFIDITVTELCDEAKVSRRTFYRNFNNINEVLNYISSNVCRELHDKLIKHNSEDLNEIILSYFVFWKSKDELLKILFFANQQTSLFFEHMKVMNDVLFLSYESSLKAKESNLSDVILTFIVGGLWSVLTYWVYHDFSLTPEDISKRLCEKFNFFN